MHKSLGAFWGAVALAATVATLVTVLAETRAAATPAPAAMLASSQIPRACDRCWPYEASCRSGFAPFVRRVALDRF